MHLVRAAHPLHALATALVLTVAALASGRKARIDLIAKPAFYGDEA